MAVLPASIHPFFAVLPRVNRTESSSTARIGFLDFSAEIRNRIYDYALVLPFIIRNDPVKRRNMKLRHPDW